MHKHFSSFGEYIYKEARLCYEVHSASPESEGSMETAGRIAAESLAEFSTYVKSEIQSALGIENRTIANLQSEAEWISAFGDDKLFREILGPDGELQPEEPPIALGALQDRVIGPRQYLQSLPLEERRQLYVRFLRKLVPEQVRLQYRGGFERIQDTLTPQIGVLMRAPQHQRDRLLQGMNRILGTEYNPPLQVDITQDPLTGNIVIAVFPDIGPPQSNDTTAAKREQAENLLNTTVAAATTAADLAAMLNGFSDPEKQLVSALPPYRRRELLLDANALFGINNPPLEVRQLADGSWEAHETGLPYMEDLPLTEPYSPRNGNWQIDTAALETLGGEINGVNVDDAERWNLAMFGGAGAPSAISQSHVTANVFRDPAFGPLPAGVENYFAAAALEGRSVDIGAPNSTSFEILRDVQRYLTGADVVVANHESANQREKVAIDIARQTVVAHYTGNVLPVAPGSAAIEPAAVTSLYAHLNVEESIRSRLPMFTDYAKLVKEKNLNDRQRIEPSAFKNLRSQSANMFLAGIRLGIITKSHLESQLAPTLRTKELITSRDRAQVQEEVDKATAKLKREQIRMETSTIMQNYHSMSGGAKILLWGALGYATWRMLKSKNKYIKILPFLPVGYYFYQRLVKGDPNALNNMGVGLKGIINRIGDLTDKGKEALGFSTEEENPVFMYLDEAQQYISENNLDETSATLFAALGEVSLSTIAANMQDGDVNLERGSTLYLELTRTFDGDDRYILELAKDPARRKELYQNLQDLMFRLGGLLRPAVFERMENTMKQYGVVDVPEDLSRIPDEATRNRFAQDYELLVNLGKGKAARTSGSLGESLGEFINKPERERPAEENAQIVEEPLLLENRQAERAMYENIGNYENFKTGKIDREHLLQDMTPEDTKRGINDLLRLGLVRDGISRIQIEKAFESALAEGSTPADAKMGIDNLIRLDLVRDSVSRAKLEEVFESALEGALILEHVRESIDNLIDMNLVREGAARTYLETVFRNAMLEKDANGHEPMLRDVVLRIEKLEYALLIYCLNTNKNLPLDVDALRSIGDNPGTDGFLDRFVSAVNREVLAVSSRPHTVENLDNVISILRERWFTQSVESMNNRGFAELIERIESYQSVFNTLRTSGPLNPSYAEDHGFDTAAAFDKFAEETLQIGSRTDRVNQMERYFAQLLANDVLLAMLTTHVRTGIHDLDRYPPIRQITPHEEENIIRAGDRYLKMVTGIHFDNGPLARNNDRHPGDDAFWEMLDIIHNRRIGTPPDDDVESRADDPSDDTDTDTPPPLDDTESDSPSPDDDVDSRGSTPDTDVPGTGTSPDDVPGRGTDVDPDVPGTGTSPDDTSGRGTDAEDLSR